MELSTMTLKMCQMALRDRIIDMRKDQDETNLQGAVIQIYEKALDEESIQNQQIATLAVAEQYLGSNDKPPSFGDDDKLDINARTSRALRDHLEELQNKKILNDAFEPRVFDKKANTALDVLVKDRIAEAGVKPHELNNIMVHLWSMENNNSSAVSPEVHALGEAVALRNLMDMIVNGKTPSDSVGRKPEVDVNWGAPWTNHNSGDRFFSSATYRALYNEKLSPNTHLKTSVLFDKAGYSDKNYEILLEAAKRVGIDPHEENRDIPEMEVGELAIEIMSIQAEKAWCRIAPDTAFDETKIHEMIHDKRFMPHLDDLKLVDAGFGVPQKYKADAQAMGANSWRLEYGLDHEDLSIRKNILEYRTTEFQNRFGELPQEAIERKPHQIPEEAYGTPASYYNNPAYGTVSVSREPSRYELARSEWLKEYQTVFEDNACSVPNYAGHGNDFSKAVGEPTAKTGAECINGNCKDCTIEGVMERDIDKLRLYPSSPDYEQPSDKTTEEEIRKLTKDAGLGGI